MQNAKNKFLDVIGWAAVLVITVAAFTGTYYFTPPAPVLAIVWLSWLVLSLLFAYFTEKGKQVFLFAKEAKIELEKVVWPNRQETTQTTFIVMLMVTVTGFILWGIDSGMMWAIGKITQLG